MDANAIDLLWREGVTFVGKGKKIVDGKQTDEDAIIVGVVEKKPLEELSKKQIIPKEIGGQKTDVVQTGVIKKRTPTKFDYEEAERVTRQRPIFPGISCGHYAITAGTFGAVVYSETFQDPTEDSKLSFWYRFLLRVLRWMGFIQEADLELLAFPLSETKTYILSNNHVLANENKAKIGDPIWQPGKYDGGGKNDEVAKLMEFVPISNRKTNKVDVAIAEITEKYKADIYQIGIPKEPRYDITPGEYITKSGRTTGTTKAKVIAVDAHTEVLYDMGYTEWGGQIIVGRCDDGKSSSDGGDSGSLGVDADKRPVGLLFAGSDEVTIYNPIQDVIKELKTKIYF